MSYLFPYAVVFPSCLYSFPCYTNLVVVVVVVVFVVVVVVVVPITHLYQTGPVPAWGWWGDPDRHDLYHLYPTTPPVPHHTTPPARQTIHPVVW